MTHYAARPVSDRVVALLALTLFAACNTYSDALLTGTPTPTAGASAGGSAGSPGTDTGGAAQGGRAETEEGAGAAGDGEEPSAHAGQSNETGGNGGSSGASTPGEAGKGGNANHGGNAGSAGGSSGPVGDQIDDFEDQDDFILRLCMRNGPWYVINDGTTTGTTGPTKTFPTLAPADVRPGGTGSAALHLTATGYADWGAGVGADMVNQMGKKAPYDASAYRAIRFYAKIGSGAASTVKVLFPTVYSDADGGKCNDKDTAKRCGDHFFKSVSGLKTTWDLYEVKFTELTQQGFGLPQTSFDPTGLYSIQFTLVNKLPIDLWLDDVSFVPK